MDRQDGEIVRRMPVDRREPVDAETMLAREWLVTNGLGGSASGAVAGPYIDAWLRIYPDDVAGARAALAGFEAHLGEACLGTISEVFDAESPYTPRGCVAQAWSVAEVLRSLVKIASPDTPSSSDGRQAPPQPIGPPAASG